jgi:hypothetical protein
LKLWTGLTFALAGWAPALFIPTHGLGEVVALERAVSDVGAPQDSLRITLQAPRDVAAGAEIPFTIRIQNVSAREVFVSLRGRPVAFDLIVARPDGTVVWRRLGGDAISAILATAVLQPGESLELSDIWDQRASNGTRVPAGEYRVRGEALAPGKPLQTDTVTLRIRENP